jgi:Ca-activated chloride channel family protein
MRFATPEYFYLGVFAIALIGLFVLWSARKKRRLLELFADKKLVGGLTANFSLQKRRYKYLLLFLGLIFLVLALARPQYGTHMVMLKREGQDVMLVVDCSKSMLAEDMKPNRLDKAKQEVRGLISRMTGDRVGLVAFAGAAFTQCPLTLDYSAAQMFIDVLDVDLIPTPGTNIGAAIEAATAAFNQKERKNKIMIIITDGEDFGGDIKRAVKEAKVQGVKIFTIGLGKPEGEPIPIRNDRGEMIGYKKDGRGELVLTRLDEQMLQEIAADADGRYYHASAGEIALDQIYEDINALEKKEQKGMLMTQYEDRYQYVLPFAILCFGAEILISERKSRRKENAADETD